GIEVDSEEQGVVVPLRVEVTEVDSKSKLEEVRSRVEVVPIGDGSGEWSARCGRPIVLQVEISEGSLGRRSAGFDLHKNIYI
ncbi:hypothetical protein V2J09_017366, partial [Rumex salicifolius]